MLLHHILGQITSFVYIINRNFTASIASNSFFKICEKQKFRESRVAKEFKLEGTCLFFKNKNVICFVIYFFKLTFFVPKLGFSKEELTWLQSLRGVPHVIQTQLSPVLLYLTDLDQFLHHWDVTEVIVHLKRNLWLLKFCSSTTNSYYILGLPCRRSFQR